MVRDHMKADPFSGAVYGFRARRADRIKLNFWDGTSLRLYAKRLEEGVFRWPKIEDGRMRLSAELSASWLSSARRSSSPRPSTTCRRAGKI
ncbi:IS66 family insertion sequence element accessory protein TnpB [Bradyrhizobium ottawaense]|uniref:IS66 family insertion sequence element accessory protein TnpB n=1 Tax=Bradyrhizobium ottawaense TaxID=931866 RepID=UPI003FA04028